MQVFRRVSANWSAVCKCRCPAERVSREIDARLKNLSRTAHQKGFRPGKAPIKIIRRQDWHPGAA